MKLSFNWLADYIDLSGLTPELVAEKLTMGAFEVESIDSFGPELTGPIVVGEIVDLQAHPDPKVSKMRVTKIKVEHGQEPLQIVCGASNIAVGQRVPVALPGSIVINRHDGTSFPITLADKRGVQSHGMLCAPAELGITDSDVDGILILDPSIASTLGINIQDLLHLGKDYVLTIGSRSNRGDAVCVRGIAREVAALFQRPMREPQWQLSETNDKTSHAFSVVIDNPKDCEYFSIRSIGNIKVAPSPPFIARRLAAVGTRSINNLVDITNYVMHEWGQPMHAYDASHVKEGKFHVRRGKAGEKFTTLDGKERLLTEEMLIISDTQKVIGMPVMGGADSEISETTTDIALEAASFLPAIVRRTSRLLGLSSESGLRFERGVDAASTKQASDRAAYLISKYCAGNVPVKIGAFIAGGESKRPPVYVVLRSSEIKRHLNLDLPSSEVKDLLGRLGFSSTDPANKADKLTFAVPSFRQNDVTREIDLIEEICRIYGYDNIKEEPPAFLPLSAMPDNINAAIRSALSGQGMCEAYIKSLVLDPSKSTDRKNGDESSYLSMYASFHDSERSITVLNALSPDHQMLRQSLLPGLITALKYNLDRGEQNVWLFEMGFTYFKHNANKQLPTKDKSSAQEELKVSGVLTGNRALSNWQESGKDAAQTTVKSNRSSISFYDAKGVVENLFQFFNLSLDKISYAKGSVVPSVMHPGQAAQVIYGSSSQELGWLGQLHPAIARDLGVDAQTYLFELDVEALKQLRRKPNFKPVSTQPPVTRDLTVDLPHTTENAAVVACVSKAAIDLKKLDLVSIYPLNNELKSLSYRLTFQSESETFKSEQIEQMLKDIRQNLKDKLNASFRT